MAASSAPLTEILPPTTPPFRQSKGWRWALRLGGTALLLFFLWRLNLDPAQIGRQLLAANPWLIGLAVLGVFPLNALKAWRWQLILADLGVKIRFGEAYRLYALGTSAGSFTPGQAGDLIKAWYLQRQGYSLRTGLVSVVLDRLFDVAALVLMASSGLLVLGASFMSLLPALLSLLAGVALGLLVLSVPRLREPLLRTVLRLLLRKKTNLDEADQTEAHQNLAPLRFGRVFGLTLAATLVVLGRVWLLALAIGINLGFMELIAASSLATVISLLPVSVGGIGARDLTLVYVLGQLGYDKPKAVSLSTLILFLQLVNLLIGYLIWKVQPARPVADPAAARLNS